MAIVWSLMLAAVSGVAARAAEREPAGCAPEFARPSEVLTPAEMTARIDAALETAWQRDGLRPAPPCDDAEFLRRAHLDLVGKIPAVAEVDAFLENDDDDKRRQLVEDLLRRGAHAQHFANTWRGLMLVGAADNVQSQLNTPQFETWLRLRFAVNMPYDRLVDELLTAPVDEAAMMQAGGMRSFVPSPVAFFLANEQKPEMIAANTTRIFLGVQVQCAQCHDHPFSHWTRREFWSLAAFFDPSRGGDPASLPAGASARAMLIPETEIAVEPAFLDGSQPDWSDGAAKRALVSQWITSADNPYFARAAVNRMWDHFLGRGFVDPVDDLDPANPPSHPELLDELAKQLAAHDFDLNYLVRAITATRAYHLTSRTTDGAPSELASFARMPLRRMTADQLFASIVQATGYRQPRPTVRSGQVIPDLDSAAAQFRNRFADQSVPRTEAETSILQALALMNGELVSDATSLGKSETLSAVAEAPFLSSAERVEALFMATLSRRPDAEESSTFVEYVERNGSGKPERRALADVFWALLNSAEFALNH